MNVLQKLKYSGQVIKMDPLFKEIMNYIQEYRFGNEVYWGASILVGLAGFKAVDLYQKFRAKQDKNDKDSKLEKLSTQ